MTEHAQGKMVPVYDPDGGYDTLYSAIRLRVGDDTVATLDRGDYDRVNSWDENGKPDPVMVANADRLSLCWNAHDDLVGVLGDLLQALDDAGLASMPGDTMADLRGCVECARAVLGGATPAKGVHIMQVEGKEAQDGQVDF